MKTVTLYEFDIKAMKFVPCGRISYDGKKLTGDNEGMRNLLHHPIRVGGREVTATSEPVAFLHGLHFHYKNVYLWAGPVEEKLGKMAKKKAKKNSVATAIITGKGPAKRIAADAAKPVISSPDDGVVFDPRWQDDGATRGL